MKRQWDIEELIEHFTLVEEEVSILGSKIGSSRLGCALLLKYFQHEGRFPQIGMTFLRPSSTTLLASSNWMQRSLPSMTGKDARLKAIGHRSGNT